MDDEREPRRASILVRIAPAVLVVVVVSVSGWFLFFRGNTVPDVRGTTDFQPLLDAGFCVDPTYRPGVIIELGNGQYSMVADAYYIGAQDPAPGTRRSAGSTVAVTVSGSSMSGRTVAWDRIPLICPAPSV